MKVTRRGQALQSPTVAEGTRDAYIRAAVLAGFAELVAGRGADAADMVRRAGIPAHALAERDMLISWHALGNLMELAAVELETPSLGLAWALAVPTPFLNFGPLGLLARFSETIGQWCAISRSYWRFHTNAYAVSLMEAESGQDMILRLAVDDMVPPSRHQMEYTLAGVCQLMRMLAPIDDSRFVGVRFQHLKPDELALHGQAFRCPVEFGCCHNELVYRREVDSYPIGFQFAALPEMIARYAAARGGAGADGGGSVRATVEAVIPCLTGTGYCTLGRVAQLLGIGPKTLQRRLAGEGANFAELVDGARRRMAMQLLAESEAPMASIAGLLGYARTAPFTFAFRRWTGQAPRDYRKAMRQNTAGG